MQPTSGSRAVLQLALHALALVTLACLPLLRLRLPWWQLSRSELMPLAMLLSAYALSALAVMALVRTDGIRAAARALVITLSLFSLPLLGFLAIRMDVPRYQLVAIVAAAVVLIPLSVAARPLRLTAVAALAAGAVGAVGLGVRAINTPPSRTPALTESTIKSAFYPLRMVAYRNRIPRPATRGGGLDQLGERVLLGTGEGRLYALSFAAEKLGIQELPARVPANREEFAQAFSGSAKSPLRSAEYAATDPGVQTWRFRVADVIAQIRGGSVRIFASHHHWKEKERCITVRVSQIDGSLADLEGSLRDAAWRTLYETEPCITLEGPERLRSKNPFRGEEIGGKLALLDASRLLLTLGDHGFSGIESPRAYAQDPGASYGKTVLIGLETGDSEICTSGHRNPQGLYVTPAGHIWSAEHAAQGGDEINLLACGADYGWPQVTYGTDYGSFVWPLSQQQGQHEGYAKPAYAFLPSVGISSLIAIEGERFGVWRGDLLAGSLATRSLYRLVVEGERVVLSEPLAVGWRVRDLLELADGRLLLWSDDAALVTLEPAASGSIAVRFDALCGGCHRVVDGHSHRLGPDLHGLFDRPVASAPGFDAYSPALERYGGRWNEQRLDAFLRDPQGTIPGTSMAIAGIEDEAERRQILEHLRSVSTAPGQY